MDSRTKAVGRFVLRIVMSVMCGLEQYFCPVRMRRSSKKKKNNLKDQDFFLRGYLFWDGVAIYVALLHGMGSKKLTFFN